MRPAYVFLRDDREDKGEAKMEACWEESAGRENSLTTKGRAR